MVGLIYKIESEYGIYIGSTFRQIELRIAEHMRDRFCQKKCTSSKILKDAVNVTYEILESINTNDKYVLKTAERQHIIDNPLCVNIYRPHDGPISHLAKYKKVNCPICNDVMTIHSLLRHTKRKHNTV